MATTFEVKNADEFEKMISSRDFRISKALVNTILKNLKGTKRHHHALSVVCLEDEAIYDVTIDRKDFLHTLNENLSAFELEEEYEECAKIQKAIEFLKKKKKKA
jgi:protein-arginine kinase activator protein McsA